MQGGTVEIPMNSIKSTLLVICALSENYWLMIHVFLVYPQYFQDSSVTAKFKSLNSFPILLLCSTTLTSIECHREYHGLHESDLCTYTSSTPLLVHSFNNVLQPVKPGP